MPFFNKEPEKVANKSNGHENGHDVRDSSVRQFPTKRDPPDVNVENGRVDDQGWGENVVYDDLEDFPVGFFVAILLNK